jgi:transcriptional regulator with XRE-family HTH domain
MTLGERVRRRREELGLSQIELSQRAWIPQAKLSKIERNACTLTIDTAKRLARALGCGIDYLAGTWDEEEQAPADAAPPAAARG